MMPLKPSIQQCSELLIQSQVNPDIYIYIIYIYIYQILFFECASSESSRLGVRRGWKGQSTKNHGLIPSYSLCHFHPILFIVLHIFTLCSALSFVEMVLSVTPLLRKGA